MANLLPKGVATWLRSRLRRPSMALRDLWWRYMTGTIINVRWPTGNIVVDHNDPRWVDMGGAVWVDLGFSADPNDHYRPELEEKVGRQGWDWDWSTSSYDIINSRLTIRFRRGLEPWAIFFRLKWA